MSIQDEIQWWVQRGGLYLVRPLARNAPCRRAMFVRPQVWQALNGPWSSDDDEDRFARLQADLEQFIEGRRIDPTYFKGLAPRRDGIWAIRSVRPSPSIRVLGRFAEKDVFVATNYELRAPLGGFENRAWREAKRHCLAEWRKLFPTYSALIGSTIHDHVSDAIDGKYFR
jgi:hypothetical protein